MEPEESGPQGALRDNATTFLQGLSRGDRASRNQLFDLLHADLRAQAAAYLRGERPDHTLQPTAVVNEAWMRMIDQQRVEVRSKGHFMALASQAMRRVLVDHARTRQRDKRGGGRQPIRLDEELLEQNKDESLDLVAVDLALSRLQRRSARLAAVVELRFFGGMTNEEVASLQGVDRATVVRDWRAARALLTGFLREQGVDEE